MEQKQSENWIDHIVDKVYQNYSGREIVIWGAFETSYSISDKLKVRYGIDTAFYVDGNTSKIDDKKVFLADCLCGKSDKYYVIIPLPFYASIKEKMRGGGYRGGVDYYYFCDCILQQEPDYYEDAHGNRIIGKYEGLKFVFAGFNSTIELGDNAQFNNTTFYLHNDSKIQIGNHTKLKGSSINICDLSEVILGDCVEIDRADIIIRDNGKMEIKYECRLNELTVSLYEYGEIVLGEKTIVKRNAWDIKKNARLYIGSSVCCSSGIRTWSSFVLHENAVLSIGENSTISGTGFIIMNNDTSISIGNDCMLSFNIIMHSNDGHSIFDVVTGENINSSDSIRKARKIIIGNHVWIGEHSCILYNTEIGDGSIIGAMSLVKGKIPNNCIAAGNPAKVIKRNIAWSRNEGADNIIDCGEDYINYTGEFYKE